MPCEPTVNVISNYAPMSIGNYWIYDRFNTDIDGNLVFTGQDSVVIVGDTVINGYTFHQQSSFIVGANSTGTSLAGFGAYRDSSGYLINSEGSILFSATDTDDSLDFFVQELPGFVVWHISSMNLTPQAVSVEAGNFDCLEYSARLETDNPDAQDNFPKHNRTLFADGVGRVKFNLNYFSGNQQIIYELNSYSLE